MDDASTLEKAIIQMGYRSDLTLKNKLLDAFEFGSLQFLAINRLRTVYREMSYPGKTLIGDERWIRNFFLSDRPTRLGNCPRDSTVEERRRIWEEKYYNWTHFQYGPSGLKDSA